MRILLTSGYPGLGGDTTGAAREHTRHAMLSKPFRLEDLAGTVRSILEDRPAP